MSRREDFSVEWSTGHPLVHRVDCPAVRALAEAGEPVLTLIDCRRRPAPPWHSCLAVKAKRSAAGDR